MTPLTWLTRWFERRYTKRTLAKLSATLVVALVVTQLFFIWYFGSVGMSMGKTAYSNDERTVVIDSTAVRKIHDEYNPNHEEGWCLYGTENRTHVRVTRVVHAQALFKRNDRIAFTCVPETLSQLAAGRNPRLIGNVHSHVGYNESYLSRLDVLLLGRVSPVITVMGVYTRPDGVKFFSTESLTTPLNETVT
ncbi:MAG: hypothetical protein ABEI77_08075 [Halorientalis sp.]